MTQRDLVCEACGMNLVIDATNDDVILTREPASSPAPGRVTIRVANEIVHQCADNSYTAP